MNNKEKIPNNSNHDFGCSLSFLNGMLRKTTSFVQHLDTQINILIGISLGMFAFGASKFQGENGDISLAFLVLTIFSLLSTLVGLFAIHPPKWLRKRGQEESLMYNKKISSFSSSVEYGDELLKAIKNKEEIVRQYATELYNISKYYYRPKRNLFHIARRIFLLGITISFILLLKVIVS